MADMSSSYESQTLFTSMKAWQIPKSLALPTDQITFAPTPPVPSLRVHSELGSDRDVLVEEMHAAGVRCSG